MSRHGSVPLVATGLVLVIVAAIGMGLTATSASAQEEPGSGFGTFNLTAAAQAVKVIGPDPAITATVPEASVRLRNGPVGYGLASIAWPGPIAANAGSILLLLGNPVCAPPALPPPLPPPPEVPNCPGVPEKVGDNAGALNYPVRAEARTGSEEPTVTNNSAGAQMTATALDDEVSATAIIGAAEASVVGIGNTRSSSVVKVTGPSEATSTASSRLNDVSLAGGAITIGSVVSTARATTDGVIATASGATTVTDVRIAGQPVRIDRDGVHVLGQGVPLRDAIDTVNGTLAGLGMKIAFSAPSMVRRGGSVSYTPGSLVFTWTPSEDGASIVTVVLGSTTIAASAVPPFAFDIPGGGPALPPVAGGTGGFGSIGAGSGGAAPGPAVAPTITGAPRAGRFRLADAVGAGWIVLAVVGAMLIGAGAHRAAALVLTDGAGEVRACTREGSK